MLQPMKILRCYIPIFSVLMVGVLCILKVDAHYEKKLLFDFLKSHGLSNVKIVDSQMRRGLFSINGSDWKILANGGDKSTFEIMKFDADIINKMPASFGDYSKINASWRNRYEEKDFYCCRSEKFVYISIFHY